jgi:hypothetical protein
MLTLLHREVEIAQCTALLVAPTETPPVAATKRSDMPPETGAPPPSYAQKWSRYFEQVSVRLVEGALAKPGPRHG